MSNLFPQPGGPVCIQLPAGEHPGWTNWASHPHHVGICPRADAISISPSAEHHIRDTNIGYVLLNRLIALLQNAVCDLLTHLGKFLVTQPRCNREKSCSLQAGAVGWSLQLSLWGPQKCSEKLIQFLCCFPWIFRAQANLNYSKLQTKELARLYGEQVSEITSSYLSL